MNNMASALKGLISGGKPPMPNANIKKGPKVVIPSKMKGTAMKPTGRMK